LSKNLAIFCPCPETLKDAKFKGDGLTNLAEEISRELSIQAVAQFLTDCFNQLYSETW
jgi:hypothetical protein